MERVLARETGSNMLRRKTCSEKKPIGKNETHPINIIRHGIQRARTSAHRTNTHGRIAARFATLPWLSIYLLLWVHSHR